MRRRFGLLSALILTVSADEDLRASNPAATSPPAKIVNPSANPHTQPHQTSPTVMQLGVDGSYLRRDRYRWDEMYGLILTYLVFVQTLKTLKHARGDRSWLSDLHGRG